MKLYNDIVLPGVILLVLDAIFLFTMSNVFTSQIQSVQGSTLQFRALGAVICYALLIYGLYYFILRTHRPIWEAFLLGFIIYGIYETTNYATLKKWKLMTMIIDTTWGGILLALTTYITYKLT